MQEKDWKAALGSRRVLEGANLALYTAVVVAIVVVINVAVNRYFDRHWDLTPTKKYSLSPQSEKLLKALNRDVTIYVFDRERGRRQRDVTGMYSAASRRVTVRFIDPDRDPGLARKYGVRREGTTVVEAGDRHFEAQGEGEEGITNALVRVLKGQKSVYFVQGHGEHDLDSPDGTGYERLKKQLENENFQVKTLVLMQKMEIPPDCSLLVVAGPRQDYLAQEVDTIRKYASNGGRVMFMLDPAMELPNFDKLLADWNVTDQNDLVIDTNPVAQIFGTRPEMPLIIKYGTSPIVQPLARVATLFPLTRSFSIGKDSKPGVFAESLCETSAESYGVADFNRKMKEVTFRPGRDFKGPLSVALSGTVTGEGEKKTEGRFAVLGTSEIAANVYLGFQGNRDLIMNIFNWLVAEEDMISIRPKPPESQRLNINARQMRQVLFLGVIGLPLLIVAAGVGVWWRRR
jgi:ABC-type uncharacterized transport system involved in gliding motility auxiliary subunit